MPAFPDIDVESLHDLLRRLQGVGGYSTDEDGARDRELLALAHILRMGMESIDAASENTFPAVATELLTEWELEYRLPNDAARTIEQRQARLIAAMSAVGGDDLDNLLAALRQIAASAFPIKLNGNTWSADGSTPNSIFQTAVTLAQADWESPLIRKGIRSVLQRLLPVEYWGQHQQADLEDAIGVKDDATWASALHVIGRDFIRAQTVAGYTVRDPPCRRRNYGASSKIRAADLNAIQDDLLWRGATSLLEALPGADMIAFAASIGAGATVQIDSGDWRDRYLANFFVWSDTDIRPGQALDKIGGIATRASALMYSKTGGAGTGYQWDFGGALALDLVVNAATGALEIVSGEAATHYVVGIIFASQDLLGGSVIKARLTDFVDGDTMATLNAAFATSLRDRTQIRKANGSGVDAWALFAGKGGIHRLGCLVKTQRPGAGFNTYVLDTEIDWRDRLATIFVTHAPGTGSTAIPGVEGSSNKDDIFTHVAAGLHFTHNGEAAGAALNGESFRVHDSGKVRIVARSSDGALLLERAHDHSVAEQVSYLVRISTTEILGLRAGSAPAAIPALSAADATVIVPADLNLLQDLAELGQFRGEGLHTMPLGTVNRGLSPPIPAAPIVRGDEVRERAAVGAVRRFFSKSILNNGNIVLDSSIDWRRRFIWGVGRWTDGGAGFDIRPGEAQDNTHNAASGWVDASAYFGVGELGVWTAGETGHYLWIAGKGTTSSISIYVDGTTGQLMIENRRGATAYVTGFFEASFQIVPAPIPAN